MDEILKLANKVLSHLESKGLKKEASGIKEALIDFGDWDIKRRPGVFRREGPRQDPREVPLGKEVGIEKGEFYTEIDPHTGKETIEMWGMPRAMTLDELREAIEKGLLSTSYFLKQFQSAKDEKSKKFYKNLLNMAQEQQRKSMHKKLASISERLNDKGYESLSRRISNLSLKLSSKDDVVEKHKILSLESIYEESKNVKDFQENLDHLISMYDTILAKVKDFRKDYKAKILDKLAKNEISEQEALKKSVDMVRAADRAIHTQSRKISEKLAQDQSLS